MRSGPPAGSILHASTRGDWSGRCEFRGRVGTDADRRGRFGGQRVPVAAPLPARPVVGSTRPDDGGRPGGARADPGQGRSDRAADRRVRRLRPRVQRLGARGRCVCGARAGRRARLPGRRDHGVRAFVQRGARHADRAGDEGEDPAERRCGRAGRRAGRRAADDRGRQPDRPLPLQLRRRPRRRRTDDEPNGAGPSGFPGRGGEWRAGL